MNSPLSRRSFLKRSALAGAAVALSPRSWSQVSGANSDVRIAIIGLNGKGKNLANVIKNVPGARIVALCDVDSAVLARGAATVGGGVKTYVDLREVYASPDVDAVVIATPNHWHSLAGIWACQAGKDVYVEKPVSHTIWEGRQLVAAAKKYNRVVQSGAQIRSGEGLMEAVAWVRAGNLGKITASRGFCYKYRASIGKTSGPQPVPETVNYDLWTGPAPDAPLRRKRFHYDWHWQYATGNGDIGNQGMHQMDVARWFLGESSLPRHTLSVGGRLGYDDDGDTPNTQVVIHDYATAPLIFEVRGLPVKPIVPGPDNSTLEAVAATARNTPMDKYRGVSIGNIVDCEGGYIFTDSYFAATAFDRDGKVLKEFKGTDRHMANFIDVVRSRKIGQLYNPIEEGHISSALCHVGNISHRLGTAAGPDGVIEKIKGDVVLVEAYGRMIEHLKNNDVDIVKDRLTLGMPLSIDSRKECFTGEHAAAANALLRSEYRKPFVVPQLA